MGQAEEKETGKKTVKSLRSVRSIFMHADCVDWLLMGLGFIGAVGDGFTTPLVLLITSKLMNNLGGSYLNTETFMQNISKVLSILSLMLDFLIRSYDNKFFCGFF